MAVIVTANSPSSTAAPNVDCATVTEPVTVQSPSTSNEALSMLFSIALTRITSPPAMMSNGSSGSMRAAEPTGHTRPSLSVNDPAPPFAVKRSEENTCDLQSLMRTSYAVFCLKTRKKHNTTNKSTLEQRQTIV